MNRLILLSIFAFIVSVSFCQVKTEGSKKGRRIDSTESVRIADSLVKVGITDKDLEEMLKIEFAKKHPDLDKINKLSTLKLIYFAHIGIKEIDKESTDKTRAARVVDFDPVATHFERYRTSPCYNKLGFSPFGDLKIQEKRYQECEQAYYKKLQNKVLLFTGMILVIGLIVYVGIRNK